MLRQTHIVRRTIHTYFHVERNTRQHLCRKPITVVGRGVTLVRIEDLRACAHSSTHLLIQTPAKIPDEAEVAHGGRREEPELAIVRQLRHRPPVREPPTMDKGKHRFTSL